MLYFIDGFDHYVAADLPKKGWVELNYGGTIAISPTEGRRGRGALKLTHNISAFARVGHPMNNLATAVVGFAIKSGELHPVSNNGWCSWGFRDVADFQVFFRFDMGNGVIYAYRGHSSTPVLLGQTAPGVFNPAIWTYVETKVTFDNSTGVVNLRVNGLEVLDLIDQDTQNTAHAYADSLVLSNQTSLGWLSQVGVGSTWFDDVYIADTTGDAPTNDFLGDCRVDVLYPNGEGVTQQWTPSTGVTHYTLVDESVPNVTDYVEDSITGHQELFDFANLTTVTGNIYGVQLNLTAMKDDSGSRLINPLCRSGGVTYDSANQALSTYYTDIQKLWTEDPATDAPWTESGVNGAQFGAETA